MTTLKLRGKLNFALGYDILVLKCRLGHGKMRTIYEIGGIISKKNKKYKTYDFFVIFRKVSPLSEYCGSKNNLPPME